MEIFETLSSLGYGELHFGRDEASGLRTIVALHSTRLGPAIGGSRLRAYATEADASRALEKVAERNRDWDEDPRWNDKDE